MPTHGLEGPRSFRMGALTPRLSEQHVVLVAAGEPWSWVCKPSHSVLSKAWPLPDGHRLRAQGRFAKQGELSDEVRKGESHPQGCLRDRVFFPPLTLLSGLD